MTFVIMKCSKTSYIMKCNKLLLWTVVIPFPGWNEDIDEHNNRVEPVHEYILVGYRGVLPREEKGPVDDGDQ